MQSYSNYAYYPGQQQQQQQQQYFSPPSYPTGANSGYSPFVNYGGQRLASAAPYANGTPYPTSAASFPPNSTPFPQPKPFIPPDLVAQIVPSKSMTKQPKTAKQRSSTVPAHGSAPVKSAIKRSSTANVVPTHQVRLERQRTSSGTSRPATAPSRETVTRTRTKSDAQSAVAKAKASFQSCQMFMTFHGNNELVVEHITEAAMSEIRQQIFGIWKDGIESDEQRDSIWRVKFKNTPWNMSGPHKKRAWDMIVTLFRVFAIRGYAFQTSINIGFQPPRLVFVARAMDKTARFFLAFFTKGGLRINLIHPPSVVQDSIGHALRDAFPDLIAYDEDIDHIRSIELKREATRKTRRLNFEPTQSSASTVDASYFLLRVLRALSDVGFNLETTIPLGSNSNWSLRSSTDIGTHRELYVFKGVPSHRVG
ncbi:hypothetical protein ARMSODRAFT_949248 [Armillaria solidipes]|uniref:Uncharacterized protein n=1 Tax=Armillaria solidipes TaxID=1076256 RepID=A0A2H3CPX7_9AGAR|nr:hypothetical protein ARMSODRAFT_949248 [Armillaria solidipes]